MVTSLFMSYTNPYTVDQPINPYANLYTNPELNTIDKNQEQLRTMHELSDNITSIAVTRV